MKKLLICMLTTLTPLAAKAADTIHFLPFESAMVALKASDKFDGGVKFNIANQPHTGDEKSLGTFTITKKANSFSRSGVDACKLATQLALIELQTLAIKQGGDAVINIESFYDNKAPTETDSYECHVGVMYADVSLRGTVIKLKPSN